MHFLVILLVLTFTPFALCHKQDLPPDVAKDLITDLLPSDQACDPDIEESFFQELRQAHNKSIITLLKDQKPNFAKICNRFQFLGCDRSTQHCICIKDTFLGEQGKCQVKQGVTLSCHPTLAPSWIEEPVELEHLTYANLNMTPLTGATGTVCDTHDYSYQCEMEDQCDSENRRFKRDFESIRNTTNKALWIQAGQPCDDELVKAYQKDGNLDYSIDVVRIRGIIHQSMLQGNHCNILDGYTCVDKICSCPADAMEINGTCKVIEGGVCSRYYWFSGNWLEDFAECAPNLECLLAHDGINRVCCQPWNTVTGVGRCRCNEYIPFLHARKRNGTTCAGSQE